MNDQKYSMCCGYLATQVKIDTRNPYVCRNCFKECETRDYEETREVKLLKEILQTLKYIEAKL